MSFPLKCFQTPSYQGAWFAFEGDRLALRDSIRDFLRSELQDPEGSLAVDEQGPHWRGLRETHLSYSHTKGKALLVYSSESAIGVDLELRSRSSANPPLEIAERFFAPAEAARLRALASPDADAGKDAFLDLWLKKESYGKLTRKGLKHSLPIEVSGLDSVIFEEVPVAPEGYRAVTARFR